MPFYHDAMLSVVVLGVLVSDRSRRGDWGFLSHAEATGADDDHRRDEHAGDDRRGDRGVACECI